MVAQTGPEWQHFEMVIEHAERQGDKETRPYAGRSLIAFDFDGTLTTRDTFIAFLRWRSGAARFALGLLRLAPAALAYARSKDAEPFKAAATAVYLKGALEATLKDEAEAFAAARFHRLIRPDAAAAFAGHLAEGAEVAIVTASPELVIQPFAQRLGASRLIGTRLEADAEGRLTGRLEGRNCRGEEKVARLQADYGQDFALDAAYGDTQGDAEMLAAARRPFMKLFTAKP